MQTIDANKVTRDSILESDICIVGGGAAGIAIANRLANLNVGVLLLESGSHQYDQKTQDLYDFENVGYPLRAQKGYISRNRYLGGSTNTWLGRSAPIQDIDFKKRDWVPNSGWPISEQDLEPFYSDTAITLKLPDSSFLFNEEWRKFLLDPPEQFLGNRGLLPTVFLLGKKHINMRTVYSKKIVASKNIQILINANVTEIVTDKDETQIKTIVVKTLNGNMFNVNCNDYVLACGGWENVRILLSSRRVNKNGVGNCFDNVGRYYTEHPKILGSKLYLNSKVLKSPIMFWKKKISKEGFVRLTIRLSDKLQEKHSLPNSNIEVLYPKTLSDAIAQSENFFNSLGFTKSAIHNFVKLAPYAFSLAESFERMLLNLPLRFDHGVVYSHMEQIPTRESRLMLSDQCDELGMPKLRVNLQVSKQDKENMKKFHEVLSNELYEQELGKFVSELPSSDGEWSGLSDSSHHMGTTRMSDDPATGVVDKNCEVHGIHNLYIAGSSVFPTGGHVNPTFTIVALSLRLADYLKGKYS